MSQQLAYGKRETRSAQPEEKLVHIKRQAKYSEDSSHPSWHLHKKHVFVLTNAAKPVFSRWGDEDKLSSVFGVMQALISFARDRGDVLRSITAHPFKFVFFTDDPLHFVCIAKTGEAESELRLQLAYLKCALVSLLSLSYQARLERQPSFDLRKLLGGTEMNLASIVRRFTRDPGYMLGACPIFRMPVAQRREIIDALRQRRPQGLLFALLFIDTQLVCYLHPHDPRKPRRYKLTPTDLLVIANFLHSPALKLQRESFAPLCLPEFAPKGLLQTYIRCLDRTRFHGHELFFLLITDQMLEPMFFALQEYASAIAQNLEEGPLGQPLRSGQIDRAAYTLREIFPNAMPSAPVRIASPHAPRTQDDAPAPDSTSSAASAPTAPTPAPASMSVLTCACPNYNYQIAGLRHFLYKSAGHQQYTAPLLEPPYGTQTAQLRLFRLYERVHARLHGAQYHTQYTCPGVDLPLPARHENAAEREKQERLRAIQQKREERDRLYRQQKQERRAQAAQAAQADAEREAKLRELKRRREERDRAYEEQLARERSAAEGSEATPPSPDSGEAPEGKGTGEGTSAEPPPQASSAPPCDSPPEAPPAPPTPSVHTTPSTQAAPAPPTPPVHTTPPTQAAPAAPREANKPPFFSFLPRTSTLPLPASSSGSFPHAPKAPGCDRGVLGGGGAPGAATARLVYQVTQRETLLGLASDEHQVYACFDPFVLKAQALNAAGKIIRWVKKEEDQLFLTCSTRW